MSKVIVRYSDAENTQIIKSVANKLPSQTMGDVFKKLEEQMTNRSQGSIQSQYYSLMRANRLKVTPQKKEKQTKVSRKVYMTNKMFNLLTTEQKDALLKEALGIV